MWVYVRVFEYESLYVRVTVCKCLYVRVRVRASSGANEATNLQKGALSLLPNRPFMGLTIYWRKKRCRLAQNEFAQFRKYRDS